MNTELATRQNELTSKKHIASSDTAVRAAKTTQNKYTNHFSFWDKESIDHEDIVWELPEHCVEELQTIGQMEQSEVINNVQKYLPKTVEFTNRLRNELTFGSGVAIVDGFQVKHNSEETNRFQCKIFSSLLSALMPQNIAGDLLYDVKDKKTPNPEKVRKSITNKAQPFHTDGGWMSPPAKFIGLFCLENANSGGISLATSLYSAFNSLSDANQQALFNSLPWDKQGEFRDNETSVAFNPGFQLSAKGEFIGRFYESYVRDGYCLKEETIPKTVCEALTELSQRLQKNTSVRFTMKPGQYQFVNNWNTVHARMAFSDSEGSTRHLIRTWHS